MVIGNRYRLFSKPPFPDIFAVILHDLKTLQEVIGLFCLATNPVADDLRKQTSSNSLVLGEGIVALGGMTGDSELYLWRTLPTACIPAFGGSSTSRITFEPSTADVYEQVLAALRSGSE